MTTDKMPSPRCDTEMQLKYIFNNNYLFIEYI